mmetsp:Transcript_52267/g.86697  ORF Transcript_52267/g.86697 Transcript_52267/m.86697 type:complete len:377 (-) Transcript_52267:276-1406(-)
MDSSKTNQESAAVEDDSQAAIDVSDVSSAMEHAMFRDTGGRPSELEKKTDQLFAALDKDGDDRITRAELKSIVLSLTRHGKEHGNLKLSVEAARNSRHRILKVIIVLTFVCAILLAGNLGLIFVALEAFKETEVKHYKVDTSLSMETATQPEVPLLTDTSGRSIATSEALQPWPLILAPLLDMSILVKVNRLLLPKQTGGSVGFLVERFEWQDKLNMRFKSTDGAIITIAAGTVHVSDPSAPINETDWYACATAEAECSATDVQGLTVFEKLNEMWEFAEEVGVSLDAVFDTKNDQLEKQRELEATHDNIEGGLAMNDWARGPARELHECPPWRPVHYKRDGKHKCRAPPQATFCNNDFPIKLHAGTAHAGTAHHG